MAIMLLLLRKIKSRVTSILDRLSIILITSKATISPSVEANSQKSSVGFGYLCIDYWGWWNNRPWSLKKIWGLVGALYLLSCPV